MHADHGGTFHSGPLRVFLLSTAAGCTNFFHREQKGKQTDRRNDMKDKNVTVNSPNFFEWLALMFIGLRLMRVIAWPWIWVLAPLWLPVCLVIIIACVVVLCGK